MLIIYLIFLLSVSLIFHIGVPNSLDHYLLNNKIHQLQRLGNEIIQYPSLQRLSIRSKQDNSPIQYYLNTISDTTQTEIWLVGSRWELLLCTNRSFPIPHHSSLPRLLVPIQDRSFYVHGSFHGILKRDSLSIIVPSHLPHSRINAIILHYPLSLLQRDRDILVNQGALLLLIFFILSLTAMFLIYVIIKRPLKKLTYAAKLCASFSPLYPFDLKFDDEFQDIYSNLNYISLHVKNFSRTERKLMSDISHDFRSPLTSIKGYSQAMLDGTIPTEKYPKYLNIIMSESIRLTQMTQALMSTSNLAEQKKNLIISSFNINDLIRRVIDHNEIHLVKKQLHIVLNLHSAIENVYADHQKIQQVVYNLLDNAIKFSNPGSEIIISTYQKYRTVYVSIKDFGIGIPASDLPYIWIRFFKSDTSRGKDKNGTGLGLSIVREIIQHHDQEINVISTPGVGTEFTFTLSVKREKRS